MRPLPFQNDIDGVGREQEGLTRKISTESLRGLQFPQFPQLPASTRQPQHPPQPPPVAPSPPRTPISLKQTLLFPGKLYTLNGMLFIDSGFEENPVNGYNDKDVGLRESQDIETTYDNTQVVVQIGGGVHLRLAAYDDNIFDRLQVGSDGLVVVRTPLNSTLVQKNSDADYFVVQNQNEEKTKLMPAYFKEKLLANSTGMKQEAQDEEKTKLMSASFIQLLTISELMEKSQDSRYEVNKAFTIRSGDLKITFYKGAKFQLKWSGQKKDITLTFTDDDGASFSVTVQQGAYPKESLNLIQIN